MKKFDHSILTATVCAAALTAWAVAPALAAPPTPQAKPARSAMSGDAIGAIRVEGNQRIETGTVLSYLGLKPGNRFSRGDIDAGLKNLFATGFFSDVKLVRAGNALVVRVTENPIISKVAFEGNDKLETKDLEKELELKPRSIYSRDKVQSDVRRILDLYRRGGRFNATVEPKIIAQEQNRVDLVYEITEGPVARVRKINFIGNNVFSNSELRDAVRTEETGWYKILTDNDKYDPDRLQFDQELLRRFYVSQGYADFQVKSAHAELSPAKDAFFITFVVEEGQEYHFGAVKVESELKSGEKPDFSEAITTKSGELYNASKVEDSIDAMTKELGNRGYAFTEIQPRLDRRKEQKLVDLTYTVKPGPRVYVERINITGNVRTLDEVIRREFRLAEGDPYNSAKLSRTEQRLNNLGFFEKVEVKNESGSAPDRTLVNVDVKEKSTGEVNLGAGYSTTDGVLGDFGVSERNLLGRGQELRTRFTYAARRKQAELGFTEPYFLNRELAAGFDVFRTAQDFQRESSYDIDMKGFNLRTSYALQEKLQHAITYSLRTSDITDVQSNASRFVKEQAGSNTTSSLGHSLTYDDRNNKFNPTRGYFVKFAQEVAGLGGDSKYLKHEIKASYYYPLAKEWSLGFLGSGGYIMGLGGKDVRINDRFFIGGDDFRGFRNAGIGPRDTTTRDALGGNAYSVVTAELKFPLGLPDEIGLSGAAFTDAGSLWDVDETGPEVFDKNSIRVSSGVGVLWSSPFGPIRIDFAHPFVKEKNDLTEHFRFSFGTRF